MALNATALKNAIKSAIDSIDAENGEISNDALLEATASAIIDHIKNNGQVIIAGGSSSGTYSIT